MGVGELKVLGADPKLSPFVARVTIALRMKGLSYEYIVEDIPRNKSQLLLQLNPVYKTVPVLIHNGKHVCDSLNILNYIDELWPSGNNILPQNPYDRAIARFWVAFIDTKMVGNIVGVLLNHDGEARTKAMEGIVDNMMEIENALQNNFNGKEYFGGDEIGYVDLVLGTLVPVIKATEIMGNSVVFDDEKMPRISTWITRFNSNGVVRDMLPHPSVIVSYNLSKLLHSTTRKSQ